MEKVRKLFRRIVIIAFTVLFSNASYAKECEYSSVNFEYPVRQISTGEFEYISPSYFYCDSVNKPDKHFSVIMPECPVMIYKTDDTNTFMFFEGNECIHFNITIDNTFSINTIDKEDAVTYLEIILPEYSDHLYSGFYQYSIVSELKAHTFYDRLKAIIEDIRNTENVNMSVNIVDVDSRYGVEIELYSIKPKNLLKMFRIISSLRFIKKDEVICLDSSK